MKQINMKKLIIYKLTDKDAPKDEPLYFTLLGLKYHIIHEIWEIFEYLDEITDNFTHKDICENNEYTFAYLEKTNYQVERILLDEYNFSE
jgi:hypothetical protein